MPTLLEAPRTWRPTREQWGLVALLVVAFVLRVASITGVGHTGDLFALSAWARGMAAVGPERYYAAGGLANYPPLLYLLWPLGVAFEGADLRIAIRALSIPFDLVLGVLLFAIGTRLAGEIRPARGTAAGPRRQADAERAGLAAAAFYLLNPAVIVSGPLWGQVDGIAALPMVGALLAVASGRTTLAVVLATLAGLVKPQFGIAAFVVAWVLLSRLREPDGARRAALGGLAALATFAVVMLPLGLGPTAYVHLVSLTADRYPYYSLFGFNPWAIAFGFGDKDGGAYLWGLAITAVAIVASLLLLRRRRDLAGLLGVGALIGLAVYFLPTRVHERYLFGAVVLLAPLAALVPRLRGPYVLLSGLFLVTLLVVLGNTPKPAVPVPDWLRGDPQAWQIWILGGSLTLAALWTTREILRLYRARSSAM